MDYKLSDYMQEEGRGVGGIRLGVGVKVTSLLWDDSNKKLFILNTESKNHAKNKKVICDGHCDCCSDTSECYDLSQS